MRTCAACAVDVVDRVQREVEVDHVRHLSPYNASVLRILNPKPHVPLASRLGAPIRPGKTGKMEGASGGGAEANVDGIDAAGDNVCGDQHLLALLVSTVPEPTPSIPPRLQTHTLREPDMKSRICACLSVCPKT